jgi:hypothetical protein
VGPPGDLGSGVVGCPRKGGVCVVAGGKFAPVAGGPSEVPPEDGGVLTPPGGEYGAFAGPSEVPPKDGGFFVVAEGEVVPVVGDRAGAGLYVDMPGVCVCTGADDCAGAVVCDPFGCALVTGRV